jgi:hypothetical protein
MEITTGYNSRVPQWGLTWLNQVQYFYQHLCLIDSEVLRNPPLRQAAKRFTTLPAGAQKTLRGPIKNGISDAASAASHLHSQYYTGRFKHLSSKFYFQLKFF